MDVFSEVLTHNYLALMAIPLVCGHNRDLRLTLDWNEASDSLNHLPSSSLSGSRGVISVTADTLSSLSLHPVQSEIGCPMVLISREKWHQPTLP